MKKALPGFIPATPLTQHFPCGNRFRECSRTFPDFRSMKLLMPAATFLPTELQIVKAIVGAAKNNLINVTGIDV